MGYDMYFVAKPDGEAERYEQASALFHAAVKIRNDIPKEEHGQYTQEEAKSGNFDVAPVNASVRYKRAQEAVTNAYNAMMAERRSYFRLNVWGMGRFVDAMAALGMTFDSRSPDPWPQASGRIEDLAYELKHDGDTAGATDEELTEARVHAAAISAFLRAHPAGGEVIPTHKFGSNDGWIVTPDEIRAALKAYGSIGDPGLALSMAGVQRDHWDQWITYLTAAVDHDGFEVW